MAVPVVTAGTAAEVAGQSLRRRGLQFSTNGTVVLQHGDGGDATATFGFPLSSGSGPLLVVGALAKERWTAFAVGADALVGVLEYFDVWP